MMVLLYPVMSQFGITALAEVFIALGVVGIAVSILTLISKKLMWLLWLWLVIFIVYCVGVILTSLGIH
jgi:hypothetical protein